MTWAELVEQTARRLRIPRKDARTALAWLFERIAAEAKLGERVTVPGFGTFRPKTHKARTIRNPATGELMQLPGMATVGFRASAAQRKKARR